MPKPPRPEELLIALNAQDSTLVANDTMAEAGRKVMRRQLVLALTQQPGVVLGEDIEAVHDMRVATRRIRSVVRLLGDFYKPRALESHEAGLRKLARALGEVRDLDVLIKGLDAYQARLPADDAQRPALDRVIERAAQQRAVDRYALLRLFDKNGHQRFVSDFAGFLLTAGAGARETEAGGVTPVEVRYALPPLIYEHLAAVRAYDAVLPDAPDEQLHMLRIEFKRLRYATTLFEEVLGSAIKDFNKELAAFQDHLGRMQDIVVAQDRVSALLGEANEAGSTSALQPYFDGLEAEHVALREGLAARWKKFNTKSVMGKLGAAVAAL